MSTREKQPDPAKKKYEHTLKVASEQAKKKFKDMIQDASELDYVQRAPPKTPKELAEIIRTASRLEKKQQPLEAHLQDIEVRRAQETDAFLRACAIRIGIDCDHENDAED